jgi:hypothetical protein
MGRIVSTTFGGSRERLLVHVVGERGIDDGELKGLRRLLNERLKDGGTADGSSPGGHTRR